MTATKAPTKGTTRAPSKDAETITDKLETNVEQSEEERKAEAAAKSKATKEANAKAKKKAEADAKKAAPMGYLQNKEGRVFVSNPILNKQRLKGKFGLIKISKSSFDEAMENGGMTDPIEDDGSEEDL